MPEEEKQSYFSLTDTALRIIYLQKSLFYQEPEYSDDPNSTYGHK